jgi:hypothetical protein
MNITKITVLLLTTILSFSACNSNEKGTVLITAEQFKSLTWDKANAGKRLGIVGYPAVSTDLNITANQKGTLTIFTEPDEKGKIIAQFYIKMGDSKNEMYVPDKFTNADLIVYDNEGKKLTTKDKILFSFTVDMDTKREPLIVEINQIKHTEYFGQGPISIRIDKAN